MILLNKAKNYISNGAMDFWQRNSTFAAIANAYFADRFLYLKNKGLMQPPFYNSMRSFNMKYLLLLLISFSAYSADNSWERGNPVGTVISHAGASCPSGYLKNDASAVSRTTYAKLFTAISTTYGVGDGSTTFNLPAPLGLPVGQVVVMSLACPAGTLLQDGTAISRTTYSALFTAIGTTYGVGDGSTTFNKPNTQGIFLKGAGSQTISAIVHAGTLAATENDQAQGHHHDYYAGSAGGGAINASSYGGAYSTLQILNSSTGYDLVFNPRTDGTNGTPRTGTVTRPANVSVNYCIRYMPTMNTCIKY